MRWNVIRILLSAVVLINTAQVKQGSSTSPQNPSSESGPGSGKHGGTREKSSSSHKGGQFGNATITGCLSGPNDEGVYVLTHGKKSVEVGGLDDLDKHVNHEVRLHGSWTKNPADIGEKEAAATGGKETKEEKGERHFKVTSIDHIADTCAAGGGGEHHKKGSGTSQPSTPPKS